MYALRVREEFSVWPEAHRERCWVRAPTYTSLFLRDRVVHQEFWTVLAFFEVATSSKSVLVQHTVEEASVKCRHSWMRAALLDWVRRQGWLALAERLETLSAPTSSDDLNVGAVSEQDPDV
jgi:hypothetical protein